MDTEPKKQSWYQKKRYLIPMGLIGVMMAFGAAENNSSTAVQNTSIVVAPYVQPASVINDYTTLIQQKTVPATSQSTDLSNNNFYINVDGNTVHSPAYSDSAPAGASAQCRDGTYSFSQNRRGTCSGHGGVAEWL